jgi:hypothetical protein
MDELTYERAVFLSPHHDDICFSVACIALRQTSRALVNIFTRSEYVAKGIPLPTERDERIAFITGLRTAEDERFAAVGGLTRHDLKLSEPGVRGFASFDSRDLDSEVGHVEFALQLFFDNAAGVRQQSALFCPMGIGGHRDHLLTLLAVKAMMPLLQNRFDVFLYEDLHYSSVSSVRQAGIGRAMATMSGFNLSRIRYSLSRDLFAQKLELIALYDSQFKSSIRPEDFIPADNEAPTPHEAVWRCIAD